VELELGVLAAVELLRGWGYERSFGPREDLVGLVLVVLFGGYVEEDLPTELSDAPSGRN
jgi:hypothetical protein